MAGGREVGRERGRERGKEREVKGGDGLEHINSIGTVHHITNSTCTGPTNLRCLLHRSLQPWHHSEGQRGRMMEIVGIKGYFPWLENLYQHGKVR